MERLLKEEARAGPTNAKKESAEVGVIRTLIILPERAYEPVADTGSR